MTSRPVCTACLLAYLLPLYLASSTQEFCERDDFEASCPHNKVVLIQEALYGRMSESNSCVKNGTKGCHQDVRPQLNTWCSARSSCTIPVARFVSAKINPCQDDYRSYLQASYQCVPAIPESRPQCEEVYHIGHSPVYLSSVLVADHNCGSQKNPISIRAKPGQQLSLTLLDFSGTEAGVGGGMFSGHCRSSKVYSVIKDMVAQTSPLTLCAGDTGKTMETVGNQAEVRVYPVTTEIFMLKIQATGCADPPLSSSSTVARDGNTARISCPGSPTVRTIYCSDGQWVGKLHNCTIITEDSLESPEASLMDRVTLSEEISVLIITMVALFVGVVVLVVGIVCLKRTQSAINQSDCTSTAPTHKYSHAHQQQSHNEYWPPPPPAEVVIQEDAYKSCEADGPNNQYYRTWQLQQHHHSALPTDRSQHRGIGQLVTASSADKEPPRSTDSMERGRQTEHIYESPQFDRASVYSAPGGRAASTVTQSSSYFDLHQGIGQK